MDIFNNGKTSYEVSLIKTSENSGIITRSNNPNFPEGTHIEFAWHNFAKIDPVKVLQSVQLPDNTTEEYFDWYSNIE